MGRLARCCLQSLLKLANSVIGFIGLGMILYSLWMIRVWYKHTQSFWDDSNPPWFIYTSLGLGVSFCLITCSGYIAAETANGHCLSCYMVFIFLLVMLEATITADIFLNRNWEEVPYHSMLFLSIIYLLLCFVLFIFHFSLFLRHQDFPEDDTGRLNDLKNFVKSNLEMCKWIGLSIVGAQALSIILAMVLRAFGSNQGSYYDSDDEYVPARLPLLKNRVQQTPYIIDPRPALHYDSWYMRINNKFNRS